MCQLFRIETLNCRHLYMSVWFILFCFVFVGLFVCLEFIVPLENFFYSYVDVTITGEGLQSLTYAQHSWPLSSEVSFFATPTVTRDICLKWSYQRTRNTHTYCQAFSRGVVTITSCFYD